MASLGFGGGVIVFFLMDEAEGEEGMGVGVLGGCAEGLAAGVGGEVEALLGEEELGALEEGVGHGGNGTTKGGNDGCSMINDQLPIKFQFSREANT